MQKDFFKKIKIVYENNKILFGSILFLFLFSEGVAFASPLYSPSDHQLDPSCLPTDADCTVAVGTVASLNGLTTGTQTFATSTTATDFTITSSAGVHTFNIPDAGASARGLITTGTQTIAGAKTFSSSINTSGTGYQISGSTILSNTGTKNLFVGETAGASVSSGTRDTFVGYNAGNAISTTSANTFVGNEAGRQTTGLSNTFTGDQTGYLMTSGNYNSFFGQYAGAGFSGGDNNVVIGQSAGASSNLSSSSYNIFIGESAQGTSNSAINSSILIGYNSMATASNQAVFGSADTNGKITNFFFGNGVTKVSPSAVTLNASGGSGSNNVGGALNIAGGIGTGSAVGGAINFQTSSAGSSGSSANPLTTRMSISGTGDISFTGNVTSINNVTTSWPSSQGSASTFLKNDGSGGLSWGTALLSLNGLTGGTQTFVNDTNVTISSATTAHTLGWSGQLAASRGGTGLNGVGSANTILGVDSGGNVLEYKALAVGTTGSDFAISHSAGVLTLNLPDAGASARGAVTTGTQTFAGAKTFSGAFTFGSATINLPSSLGAAAGGSVNLCVGGSNVMTKAATCSSSSRRFKHDIQDLNTGLDQVLALRPVSFVYNDSIANTPYIGLIAEEVNQVEPRLVFYDDDGVTPHGVLYENLTALLVKGIQQQEVKITDIDTRLKGVEDLMKNNSSTTFSITDIISQLVDKIVSFGEIISNKVTTKELCLDDVCITKSQLQELLNKNGIAPSNQQPAPVVVPPSAPEESTPEPESTPEVTPPDSVVSDPAPTPVETTP